MSARPRSSVVSVALGFQAQGCLHFISGFFTARSALLLTCLRTVEGGGSFVAAYAGCSSRGTVTLWHERMNGDLYMFKCLNIKRSDIAGGWNI